MIPGLVASFFIGSSGFLAGDGTLRSPFQIATLSDLNSMRDKPSAHYVLVADIDATPTARWNDPATDSTLFEGWKPFCFHGTFDGKWHSISGLNINRPSENQLGLFSLLGHDTHSANPTETVPVASVSHLRLENASIIGKKSLGGLSGSIRYSSIQGVAVNGTIRGMSRLGMLSGELTHSKLVGIKTSGDLRGTNELGGLIGFAEGVWAHGLVSEVDIVGTDTLGGFVGHLREESVPWPDRAAPITPTRPFWPPKPPANGLRAQLVPFPGFASLRAMIQVASFKGSIKGRDHLGGAIGISSPIPPLIRYMISSGHIDGSDYLGGVCGACAWDGIHRLFDYNGIRHIIAASTIRGRKTGGIFGDSGTSLLGILLASRRSDSTHKDALSQRDDPFGCLDIFGICNHASERLIIDPIDDQLPIDKGGAGKFPNGIYDSTCLRESPECTFFAQRFSGIVWPRSKRNPEFYGPYTDSAIREFSQAIYPFGDLPPAQRDRQIKLARGQCHDLRPRFLRLGQDSITFAIDPAVPGQDSTMLTESVLCVPKPPRSDTLWLAAKSSKELTRFFVTTISDSSVRAR